MNARIWTRRNLLAAAATTPLAAAPPHIPVRAITGGPGFHWFGYYDKLQFDPSSRFALGVRGSFQHRLPRPDDTLEIGMVDTEGGDRWLDLGDTRAWSWHQTCMLQWLPGSDRLVIWNDRNEGRLLSRIVDVKSREERRLDSPIYCLAPSAKWALATDFRRLGDVRPETGYVGVPDPNRDVLAPENAGVWRVDLESGKPELILSYADVTKITDPYSDWTGAKHWFNHLLVAPDSERFVFLHRWRGPQEGRTFRTRMLSAKPDGSDLRLLDPYGHMSHFNWKDNRTLIAWCGRPVKESEAGQPLQLRKSHYLIDPLTGKASIFGEGVLTRNGHMSFLPGGRWMVTDTSPGQDRLQTVYLYDSKINEKVEIGRFYSPPQYTGYWRCDTTPRYSPDGRKVVFDSPHGGNGRQMYLADISQVTSPGKEKKR